VSGILCRSSAGLSGRRQVSCRLDRRGPEDVKWGKDLIFSVGGKMFAGFMLPEGQRLGLPT